MVKNSVIKKRYFFTFWEFCGVYHIKKLWKKYNSTEFAMLAKQYLKFIDNKLSRPFHNLE